MTAPNYYQLLGVRPTASGADLRAAYARLVKLHHPDVDGRLPARLQEVQRAYRCLSDPTARADHDRLIAEAERRHGARRMRVHRRLRRYDRRHPLPSPPSWRRRVWWSIAALAVVAAAVTAALAFA